MKSARKTLVANTPAHLRPYTQAQTPDNKQPYSDHEFRSERFTDFADTAGSAVISGSTFANSRVDETQFTLDASETRYLYDSDNVRIGISMATADGLGHEFDDIENARIAAAASQACSEFNELSESSITTGQNEYFARLQAIASHTQRATFIYMNTERAIGKNKESSLATTTVKCDEKGNLKCQLGNTGDGMIVVLDSKATRIKHQLHPKVHEHLQSTVVHSPGSKVERNALGPKSIQSVTGSTFDFTTVDLAEDDIIIHMTDGVWSELSHAPKTQLSTTVDHAEFKRKAYEKTYELDEKAFIHLFAGLEKEGPITAHAVANRVVSATATAALKQQKDFTILAQLEKQIALFNEKQKAFRKAADSNSYTLDVWERECKDAKIPLPDIASQLAKSDHDGISYPLGMKTPVAIFINDLDRKCFGDCATIAVMQAPNQRVELARALMENPHKGTQLIPRLTAAFLADEKGINPDEIVKRLQEEQHFPSPQGTGLKNINKESVYTADQIELLIACLKLVNCYVTLTKAFQACDNQYKKQAALVTVINHKQLSLVERNTLYLLAKQHHMHHINAHRKSYSTYFFSNTTGYRAMISMIRADAMAQLKKELAALNDNNQKLELLKDARTLPIFTDHRNNFVITGAYGRTQAVIDIDTLIAETSKPKVALV